MADQLSREELLVKFGFLNKEGQSKYRYDEKLGYYVASQGEPKDTVYDAKYANQEYDEEVNLNFNDQYYPTGFPKPGKRTVLIYEAFNMSLEELYFWSLNHIRQDASFPKVIKVTDIFSASENSAFFGQTAQRLSIQEDRASGFLRGISEMIKTLFQIVRELRIIDERLEIYNNWKKSKSADVTLKGLFADFAENKGGQMQPGSLYHLSNQLGYATLPDLFFNTVVYDKDNVDKVVSKLSFNDSVKAVLRRKLYQFIVWKEKTEVELKARKKFQIKYLRQHYTIIKTYMGWVKPYLKHIKRLTMNEGQMQGPDLIGSFETSTTEVELIAYKPSAKNALNSVVLMSFEFSTKPVMQYRQDYQQGPVHIGRGKMTLRTYAWSDQQIKMYQKLRDTEDKELMGLVDDQLKSAMDMLGDDLDAYLKEAEESLEEKGPSAPLKKEKLKPVGGGGSVFDPFIDVGRGFWEMGSLFVPNFKKSGAPKKGKGEDVKKALKGAATGMWMVYNNYKKAHGLLSW